MSDYSSENSIKTDVSTVHLDNISLQLRENVDTNSKFIGFDLSTQQLKAMVIDEELRVCHHVSVDFDKELSEYKTRGGVQRSDDGTNTVTAPVNMWLKALDMCMDKLKIDGLDFSTVIGISGCAQQHGSVWWRRESASLLASLNPENHLHRELVSAFTLRDSPIWMDSSTSDECRLIELHVGGPAKLAEITGSRAYERFTGPQIVKVMRTRREAYLATERIMLISNFLASILSGSYAPFDASDASGMNMMDIQTKRWSRECLEAMVSVGNKCRLAATASTTTTTNLAPLGGEQPAVAQATDLTAEVDALRAKLGCSSSLLVGDNIVDSHKVVGRISRYFIERYGFPPECLISSFTGDNPSSMAGLCVAQDELIISLGTSDTAFFWLEHPHPGVNGHVLRNPLDDSKYMGLICFKNGSKTRERIRDRYAQGDWQEFERLLGQVPRANFGNIGFYYDLREIYPLVSGDFRYNKLDQRVDAFAGPEFEVRACLESQFMRLYHHSEALGLDMAKIKRVLVTGGASENRAILQVIADIFRTPVFVLESVSNSACLGGAYLANFAYKLEQQKLDQSFGDTADVRSSEGSCGNAAAAAAAALTASLDAGSDGADGSQPGVAENKIDFSQMIRGSGQDTGDQCATNLVLAAEPTPIGASHDDVYAPLLARYIKIETEISLNNEA